MASKEKPSPFCPPECLFNGVKGMCDVDCMHSRDIVYDHPRTTEVQWHGKWVEETILGESEGKEYFRINGPVFTQQK